MSSTGSLFSKFLLQKNPDLDLPDGISIINPYQKQEVRSVVNSFCSRFYHDSSERILILGINPGRFGAGVTGIPFTDPIALENYCNIPNSFPKKHELSSRFIYVMINALGGAEKFYSKFLLSAVCPLGFLNGNKNYNYYDSPVLFNSVSGFVKKSLKQQALLNIHKTTVVSLGKKNASFLEALNREIKLFKSVITLEHPRFIMQYRLKSMHRYVDEYYKVLSGISNQL